LVTAFEEKTNSGEPFIIYLTAGPGKNGKTWCPDCDAHLATIENQIINKNKHIPILKGTVMSPKEWVGVGSHPWKTHELIRARGVPTIALFKGSECIVRAESEEDFGNEKILSIFNSN